MPRDEALIARCPTCGNPVDYARRKEFPQFPFCSRRCKLIDLGKWLNEEYRIGDEEEEEEDTQEG